MSANSSNTQVRTLLRGSVLLVRARSDHDQSRHTANQARRFFPAGEKLEVPVTVKKCEKYPSGEITQGM